MPPISGAALVKAHRWLSLAAMTFWMLQAVTGIICVFHWEIDDATIAAPHRATNLVAIGRRVAALAPPGSGRSIASIWTSAGAPDRWDVSVTGHDGASVRLDGAGDILRIRRDGEWIGDGGWLDTIDNLHQNLLGGVVGGWVVGVSGLLLLGNIVLGMTIAWPGTGRWRRALRPSRAGPLPARLYGWHRAVGLWVAIPAALVISAGVLRVFSDGFERAIGAPSPVAAAIRPDGRAISFARAAAAALAAEPGKQLSGISFPDTSDATWTIRLLGAGEARRAYGVTTVLIDGRDGRVIARRRASAGPLARRIADLIYPIHTGEALGLAGRLAVLAIGGWLASMIAMGALLWWKRPPRKRRIA